MQCSNCQTEIENDLPQCKQCGTIQDSFVYKSRVAASALAFFAGIFGAHRFYLGQWWGIFYLLFFWTYIPWIVAIIEGIVFLSTSQKRWNKDYNQDISAGTEKGTVVVVLACVFPAIALIGILAAIALPAYQDYTIRAKMAETHLVAAQTKTAVEEYVHNYQQWPASIEQLNSFPSISNNTAHNVTVEDGVVYVQAPGDLNVSGAIVYVPTASDTGITWSCTNSTLAPQYLPEECK